MEVELIRIFVKVVQNASFSRAAELLRVPKSTVSKAVTRLEQSTGTKLLLRTTRSLTLTAAGRAFYETCLGPIQILEDAQKSLHGADSILSGRVRLTAPEDLGSHVIAAALAELIRLHPALSFDLKYTNEVVDLVRDGFDLAVRLGRLKESSLKAKKVGEVFLVMVASPKYIKNSGTLKTPQDLEKHACLTIEDINTKWALQSKKASTTVPISPRITCNEMTSLMNAAIAGAGIALVPMFITKPAVEAGKLVQVLPEWRSPGWPVSLISPVASSSSARIKITSEHLMKAIQEALKAY
jgi:LysR family transcriptional regulator for bpeEF and oprC